MIWFEKKVLAARLKAHLNPQHNFTYLTSPATSGRTTHVVNEGLLFSLKGQIQAASPSNIFQILCGLDVYLAEVYGN